jgi:hypothetical protein
MDETLKGFLAGFAILLLLILFMHIMYNLGAGGLNLS